MANSWQQKDWDEWKREMEENKRRRLSWMQRVMRWASLEILKNEEEDDSQDEDDVEERVFDVRAGEGKPKEEREHKENVTILDKEEQNLENDDPQDVIVKEYWKTKRENQAGLRQEIENGFLLEGNEMPEAGTSRNLNNDEKENLGASVDDERDLDQRIRHSSDSSEFDYSSQNSDPYGSNEEFKLNYGIQIQEEEDESEQNSEMLGAIKENKEDLTIKEAEEEEGEGMEVQNMEELYTEQKETESSEDDEMESIKYDHREEDGEQNKNLSDSDECEQNENLSNSDEFDDNSQSSSSIGYENKEINYKECFSNTTKKDTYLDYQEAETSTALEELPNDSWAKASMQVDEVQESVASLTTNDKKLQDQPQDEDESTDDDETELLGEEDIDDFDQSKVKIYYQHNHPTEIFNTLKEFRDGLILTDLVLETVDGKSISVHAIVMAAVSSFVWKILYKRESTEKKSQPVNLGKGVEDVGLEAVVEFAYTGAISCLNSGTVKVIKTAARSLGAPRVLEICANLERVSSKTPAQKKEETIPASEQFRMSLEKIEGLWTNHVGCDITLDVLSASFRAHRVILAASSDYFRAMFTLGMRESTQSSVYLKFLSAPELEALIDCSYSGAVSLSWNCVFEITSTALQLQYQPALSLCLSFLEQEMNPHSCLDVASFADAFGMVQLLEIAEDFVLRQFQKVARTAKFKDLTARNLLKYLNSFALCVPSELVVFRAVVKWIEAKPKKRLRLAKELMKTIHFPLMTFREFKEVQALNIWSNHSLQELYEAIFEEFCSNQAEAQNQCRIYLPKESLVLSGGDQISDDLGSRSISKELWFGNSLRNHTGIIKAMEWRKLNEMPQPARFSHEVAVLNGQLYVIGGKKYYGTSDTLNSVFRYNPHQNSWEELAPMQQERCSFSLVVLDAKLYAIGGQCHPDYIENVEQYCPTANSWSFTFPLDLPLGGHVARVLQGQIFISGGLNNDYRCLNSMFVYHPEKGSTYLKNMTQPRSHHCMEVLGDCLYVAGGLSSSANPNIIDLLTCEMYNPAADSWTFFPPLPVPHVGAGSAVLEGKFYVLGGYSQEDYSDTKMVHRYDPTTHQWENMGKMPGPNNDLRACVLCLPEHLRQCPD